MAQRDAQTKSNEAPEPTEQGLPKRLLAQADRYQRQHAWLGFPLAVGRKFGEDGAGRLAALVAYYGFFSLFPLLLALVTVLGFVLAGNPDLQARILDSALSQFPVIGEQLRENLGTIEASGLALVVGVVGLLWAGMAAVEAGQHAMNSVWDVPLKDRPSFVSGKLRSLIMLVVLGVGLVGTTVLGGAGTYLDFLGPLSQVLLVAASVALNVGLFLLAFQILTERDLRWGELIPGAILAGASFSVLQALGGWLVTTRLQGANDTYGTFAVVIGLLSWLYLQAQITLLAAEINVVRSRSLYPRALVRDRLTPADTWALEGFAKVEERIEREEIDVRIEHPDRADAQR